MNPHAAKACRSWLYVPGDSERKLAKARGFDADVLIADLEDAVVSDRKEYARGVVADHLRAEPRHGLAYVRINGTASAHWREDILATMGAEPDGYVLPKVEQADDVLRVAEFLREAWEGERERLPELSVIVTETARGVVQAPTSIAASELVTDVHWGAEDLSGDLGAGATRGADGAYLPLFEGVRSRIVLEAKALGRRVVDAPYLVLDDLDGLRREAADAARTAFDGKQAIHPSQLEPINEEFTPTEAEVERARALVEAFNASPDATFSFRGTMVDAPHLTVAYKVLARYEAAIRGSA